jgi:hypothetical protein
MSARALINSAPTGYLIAKKQRRPKAPRQRANGLDAATDRAANKFAHFPLALA